MTDYLLSLAALHAVGPGSLDKVFGPDGDFEGAPRWSAPIWVEDQSWGNHRFEMYDWPPQDSWPNVHYLDLRIYSVFARLLRLCSFVQTVDPNMEPAELAALTFTLAPRIAALGGTHG